MIFCNKLEAAFLGLSLFLSRRIVGWLAVLAVLALLSRRD